MTLSIFIDCVTETDDFFQIPFFYLSEERDVSVTPLPFFLPRTFLDRIGFNQAIREAMRIPTDPELFALFQKLAPTFDWARARTNPGFYRPPRWLGYWGSHQAYWATDGLLKLIVPEARELQILFHQLQLVAFPERATSPFIADLRLEPRHLLLHDSEKEQLYVTPFEQGEAVLMRQPRPY